MFIKRKGVGLCSYLLIGYYFHKRSAGDAAKKAFVVNRVGDWGLSIGVMLIFLTFGFFFSSRRRHTRSLRDCSSDVCSSDLSPACTVTSAASPPSVMSRPV